MVKTKRKTVNLPEAKHLKVGDEFLIGGWIAKITDLQRTILDDYVYIEFSVGGSFRQVGEFTTPSDALFTILERE